MIEIIKKFWYGCGKKGALYCVFTISILLSRLQFCFAADDVKYFSGYELEKKLDKKTKVFLNSEARLDDDISRLFYYHFRLGVKRSLAKWFDAGLTYRFANDRKSGPNSTHYWNHENRLEIDLAPKYRFDERWLLSDRVRLEYRAFEAGPIEWRWRNLVKLVYDNFSINGFTVSPYISNETYHPMTSGKFNKDWATIGFVKKWTEHVSSDIYYRVETKRVRNTQSWDTSHIIGTSLKYSF